MLKSTILKRVISAVLVLASIFTIGAFSCFATDPDEFDPPEYDVPKIKHKTQPYYEEWRPDPKCLGDYQYCGQTWIDYEYLEFQMNHGRDYDLDYDMDDDI